MNKRSFSNPATHLWLVCTLGIIVLLENKSQVTVLLQTVAVFPLEFPYILLQSFCHLPLQAFQSLLPPLHCGNSVLVMMCSVWFAPNILSTLIPKKVNFVSSHYRNFFHMPLPSQPQNRFTGHNPSFQSREYCLF